MGDDDAGDVVTVRRWGPGAVAAAVLVAGIVGFWIYVFFIAERTQIDELDDGGYGPTAEAVCSATLDDLRADGLLDATAGSTAERATIVREIDEYLTAMVDELGGIRVGAGEDRRLVTTWLADWGVWLDDRAAWARQLDRGDDVPFSETARRTGEPNSGAVTNFAKINRMPSCAIPAGV